MNSSGKIAILSIFVILIATIIGTKNKQPSSVLINPIISPQISMPPTTAWSKFSDPKIGLSFEYPSVINGNFYNIDVKEDRLISVMESSSGIARIQIELFSDVQIKAFVSNAISSNKEYCQNKSLAYEEIVVSGKKAFKLDCDHSKEFVTNLVSGINIILVQNGNSVYRISLAPCLACDFTSVANKILDSIIFYDPGKKCVVGGCNGELCLEEGNKDVASICLWQEKFACYKSATCERQLDNKCGWTQTPQLKACLQQPS